ncbi:hypothetical protein KEJ36_05765 [Candidatus Bathyarchaeota archaeon]|nr:hypothetical protein [Candidatus Bathyarchaeota archaeon]MBS7628287.1 hypothetical protein [Candidatus Bathyarchaeota archaeon]
MEKEAIKSENHIINPSINQFHKSFIGIEIETVIDRLPYFAFTGKMSRSVPISLA